MSTKRQLNTLGFEPSDGPESLERIRELEHQIGVRLPSDYRKFLTTIGGGYLDDAIVPCSMPTPFGQHNLTCLHTASEVIDLLDSSVAPRNMICISYGHFGMTGCLSVAGIDHGHVFSLDTEMRYYWDQATINRPNWDPSIKEFFRLRDANELPERPWGYENCYHVANSFTDFLARLRRADESRD